MPVVLDQLVSNPLGFSGFPHATLRFPKLPRREGAKGSSFVATPPELTSDSKRAVIAPALGRTRRGFAPATRQLREAESRMRGAGEGEGIAHPLVKDRRPFFR